MTTRKTAPSGKRPSRGAIVFSRHMPPPDILVQFPQTTAVGWVAARCNSYPMFSPSYGGGCADGSGSPSQSIPIPAGRDIRGRRMETRYVSSLRLRGRGRRQRRGVVERLLLLHTKRRHISRG